MTAKRPGKTAKRSPSAPAAQLDEPRVAQMLASLRADPELTPVIDAFEKAKGQPGRKFGSNGLKVNGKLFALFTQGTLVLKLPKDRVADLVAGKLGKPFDPGHGRLMKEWLTVTSPKASWLELAREAFAFVSRRSD
jgi:hypothetical protein